MSTLKEVWGDNCYSGYHTPLELRPIYPLLQNWAFFDSYITLTISEMIAPTISHIAFGGMRGFCYKLVNMLGSKAPNLKVCLWIASSRWAVGHCLIYLMRSFFFIVDALITFLFVSLL